MLDDSINYLLSEDELLKALAGMKANLAPGGLLLFDVNTLVAYRSFFAETVVVERAGRRLVWRGQTASDAEPGSICDAVLEEDGGPTKRMNIGSVTLPMSKYDQRSSVPALPWSMPMASMRTGY